MAIDVEISCDSEKDSGIPHEHHLHPIRVLLFVYALHAACSRHSCMPLRKTNDEVLARPLGRSKRLRSNVRRAESNLRGPTSVPSWAFPVTEKGSKDRISEIPLTGEEPFVDVISEYLRDGFRSVGRSDQTRPPNRSCLEDSKVRVKRLMMLQWFQRFDGTGAPGYKKGFEKLGVHKKRPNLEDCAIQSTLLVTTQDEPWARDPGSRSGGIASR